METPEQIADRVVKVVPFKDDRLADVRLFGYFMSGSTEAFAVKEAEKIASFFRREIASLVAEDRKEMS
jgi:hypothetical protein